MTETLFGDIHNHNACGYGIGSMERSIDIARGHLDFFAFTGHSSWHDMVPMEGGREAHWLQGFARLRAEWPNVQRLIADANDADFAAFLGFEWHSSHFGDQCVVFPDDNQPIHHADDIADLRRFCLAKDALMIPHHLGYPQGHRGVNWHAFDEACTPVVEIFSEHGNSEHDRGPYDYFSHSMGGRDTGQTARAGLAQGLRFGFVASSDSHSGFPGAYDEGLLGMASHGRDRASIMEAIRARRTWALTGDRIEIDFTVEGALMGASIAAGRAVEATFDVRGRDEIDVVEVIQDGVIMHRAHPGAARPGAASLGQVFQIRFDWGWGPWGDLALDRITDWHFEIAVGAGRVRRVFPCLRSGPFDEDRRHAITRTETGVSVRSFTSRAGAYRQNPNQGLVLEIEGGLETVLALSLHAPAAQAMQVTAADLAEGSLSGFTGPFPKEAYQWRRAAPLAATALAGSCRLDVPDGPGHVYLRVRQTNGQMAWASPVFLNHP